MTARTRNYRAEYEHRIARGLGRGLSRSQARGHPKTAEATAVPRIPTKSDQRRLEAGLRALKSGKSLTESARSVHVAPERLRRYIGQAGFVERRGRKWIIGPDRRRRVMFLYSGGEVHTVTVDLATASEIGEYLAAVKHFLETNQPLYLSPFRGKSITDVTGKRYQLETDPNTLYRLDTTAGDAFEDIYRIVA